MSNPLSIYLSGNAFSFLLYENTKSHIQEGFLLGDILNKRSKKITDNDQAEIKHYTVVKINSVIPCPHTNYFYDGIGRVNSEKLKSFLGSEMQKVVAWYKFERTTTAAFTLREKIVHKQLSGLFQIPLDQFTMCHLTVESSSNSSTHTYSQNFMRNTNGVYERVDMNICNLSEPEETYHEAEIASKTFNNIIKDLNIDLSKTQGLEVINRIQNALQKHVDGLVNELAETEKTLYDLECEVAKDLDNLRIQKELDVMLPKPVNTRDTKETNSVEVGLIENGKTPSKGRARGRGKKKSIVEDNVGVSTRLRKRS